MSNLVKKYARYNTNARMWEYGYDVGSIFVIVARYPNINVDLDRAA